MSSFIFICLFIFQLISIFISFQSPHSSKCSSCSFINYSLTTQSVLHRSPNNVNTEDEQTSLDSYSIWCLNMAHRLDTESFLPRSPILRAPSIYSSRLNRLPYRYSQWQSSPRLPRGFTPCEHNIVMRLLMIIERICRKHHITFMLADGSLLGSWKHHDIIPWDDDIDVMIPIEEKDRFIGLIEKMNETSVKYSTVWSRNRKGKYYKISFKNTPSTGSYDWNFPFVDVFLYVKNRTHLWQMADPYTIIRAKYIFPLVMSPFGELWLPAARKPQKIFAFNPYGDCIGSHWSHRNESRKQQIRLNCADLKDIYPFVHRKSETNAEEILKINHMTIHTIVYH